VGNAADAASLRRAPELSDTSAVTRPIFIGGTGRSGTTVIGHLIGAHSEIRVIEHELYFHSAPLGLPGLITGRTGMDELLARFATRQEKLARLTRYVADDLSGEARLREFVERFSHDRVAACRFLISSLLDPLATVEGRSRWVEMTPENIAAAPFLLAMYPQAKFVHTVRDGRDVAVSRRHKRAPDTPIAHWVEHWEDALRRAHRGSRYVTSDRLLVLRFEDLVSRDREATLRRMMEFLQLGESEAVERFFETEMPANRANVGRWQRDLDDAEQRQVQVAYVRALGRLRRDEIVCAPAGDDDDDAVRILHAEAAEHLRAALSALSDASPSVRPDRGWLLATLAEAERDAGDGGKARAHYLEAAQIARDQHDPLALTAVALGLTGGKPKPWTFPDPDATATALLGERWTAWVPPQPSSRPGSTRARPPT